MDGGLRAIKVMSYIAKICGQLIVSSPLLLPQVVCRIVLTISTPDIPTDHVPSPSCPNLFDLSTLPFSISPHFSSIPLGHLA